MSNVIVSNLRKRYDDVVAADGVSFEIERGEIFGLLGPNGSGKTTTLECIIGLREPDSGEISVAGIDARRHPREVKRRIGAVLQTTSLQDKITPREALTLFASFYAQAAHVSDLLQRFALDDKADAPFESLSGGQRQRLALALAFVSNPELVFLDEPTTGLDPKTRRELHAEIARMKTDGHTVLLTTHYIDEAEELCDRIAIIDRGKIIASGAPHALIAGTTTYQSVSLVTAAPLDAALFDALPGIEELALDDTRAAFRTTSVSRTLGGLLQQLDARAIEVVDLRVKKASLEDVFIRLTGASGREQEGSRDPALQ
jgi:ABC-2 type transport system ATP-binding protein